MFNLDSFDALCSAQLTCSATLADRMKASLYRFTRFQVSQVFSGFNLNRLYSDGIVQDVLNIVAGRLTHRMTRPDRHGETLAFTDSEYTYQAGPLKGKTVSFTAADNCLRKFKAMVRTKLMNLRANGEWSARGGDCLSAVGARGRVKVQTGDLMATTDEVAFESKFRPDLHTDLNAESQKYEAARQGISHAAFKLAEERAKPLTERAVEPFAEFDAGEHTAAVVSLCPPQVQVTVGLLLKGQPVSRRRQAEAEAAVAVVAARYVSDTKWACQA